MKKKRLTSRQKWGMVFISPFVIYFCIFLLYPIYLSIHNSFFEISVLNPEKARFVGIENWINSIVDPLFWKSIFNILYNQSIFITLSTVVALFLAVLLNEIKVGGTLFRTVYFMPVITSITVAMVIFQSLASPTGPIQTALIKWGVLEEEIFWTFSEWLPMPVIAVFSVWKWTGTAMIIFLGGLASVDESILEAADLDGATWLQKIFKISLPSIKPQIMFSITMNIINGLQMFTEVYMNFDIMGGRFNSALTPVLYLYGQGFDKEKMGQASTLGLMLALIIYVLTTVEMKFFNRDEEEQ